MKDSTCHWDMCKWKYVACTDLCSDPATGCTLCNVIPVQTHKGRRMWVQVWDTHTDSSTACLIYGSVDTGLSQISVSAYTVSNMCRFFLYVMIIKFLVKITVSVFQIHFGWWSLLVNCKIPCLTTSIKGSLQKICVYVYILCILEYQAIYKYWNVFAPQYWEQT